MLYDVFMTKKYVLYYKIMNGNQIVEEKYSKEETDPEVIKKQAMMVVKAIKIHRKQFEEFKNYHVLDMAVLMKCHVFNIDEMSKILDQPVQLELKEIKPSPFEWLKEFSEKEGLSR